MFKMHLGRFLLVLAVFVPVVKSILQCEAILCLSSNNNLTFCSPSVHDVDIVSTDLAVSETSTDMCTKGETFGHMEHVIWVDKGCSAEFAVCYNIQTFNKTCTKLACSSLADMDYRECNVSTILETDVIVTSISILSTSNNKRCYEFITYGFYGDKLWVYDLCSVYIEACYVPLTSLEETDLTCESKDDGKATCIMKYPGTISYATVQEQRSKTECIFPQNYRFELNKVVVEGGCTAVFKVYYLPEFDEVQCTSVEQQKTFCSTGRQLPVKTVSLVQQISLDACHPDSSFGWESNVIWTDAGCSGTFHVTYDL